MKKRIKVLQLHADYNIKAQDFADLGEQIIKALPSDQFETVTAFLQGCPKPGEPESCADRSIYFKFSESQTKGLRLRAMQQLYHFCKTEHFDVAIGNRFKPINMLLRLNPLLNIPRCIAIVHGFGDYERLARRMEARCLINKAWRFVGVSSAVKQHLLDLHSGFKEGNTISIANAIDIDAARELQLSRAEARSHFGLPENAFVFGAIGRLVPVKGHTHLINAFAQVCEAMPGAVLVIVGEGRSRKDLASIIQQKGLQDRVLLPGMLPNAQQYIRAFDTFVMPSLSEGLALALLEAMSAEVPIIASDIPSISPILQPAGGTSVPARNESMLADALLCHFQYPPEKRTQIGQHCFAYLRKHHSIEDYKNKYLQLICDAGHR